ncbi:hypothetical protein ACNKHM_06605 [Shigella sonnei]
MCRALIGSPADSLMQLAEGVVHPRPVFLFASSGNSAANFCADTFLHNSFD